MRYLRQTVAFALLLVLPAVLMAQAVDTPDMALAVQRQRDVRSAIADIQRKLSLLVRFEQDPDVKLKALAARRMLRDTALITQAGELADLLRHGKLIPALDGQKEIIDTLGELLNLLSRARVKPELEDSHGLQVAEEIDGLIDRQDDHHRGAAVLAGKDGKGSKDGKDAQAGKDAQDAKGGKDAQGDKDGQGGKDAQGGKGAQDAQDGKDGKDGDGDGDGDEAEDLRDAQLDTLDKTKAVAEKLADAAKAEGASGALAAAGEKLASAAGKMKDAAGQLASGKPGAAGEAMEDALEDLKDAAKTLRKPDQAEQVFALQSLLRRMLKVQQDLSCRTRLLAAAPLTRLERLEFALLAKGERELTASANKALDVLGEDGTALVFPEAIKQVRADLVAVAGLLSRNDGGEITRGIQSDIERALIGMLDALAESQNDKPPDPPKPPTDGEAPPPGDPPIVSFLAELKLLRGMQDRCNRRTDCLAKVVPATVGRSVGLIYLKQLGRTGEIQGNIGRLADRLAEQLNR